MRGVVFAACLAAMGVSGHTGQAFAQTSETAARATARKVGYEGVEAFQAGNYKLASEKLEKAYAVLRVPTLGLWSARALAKNGKLVEATERYLEVQRLPLGSGDLEVQKQAQADAQGELDQNQQQTPSLQVSIVGADANDVAVTIDGVAVAKQLLGEASPVNPGRHVIEGVLGNGQRTSTELNLAPREQKVATLAFNAAQAPGNDEPASFVAGSSSTEHDGAPSSSGRRTAGWVVLGLGGVGLAVGGVTGVMALSKRSDLDEQGCAEERCPNALSGDVDSLNTLRGVSTVSFIAGGVLAATGVVLVLTAPRAQTTAALWASPGRVGLRGTF